MPTGFARSAYRRSETLCRLWPVSLSPERGLRYDRARREAAAMNSGQRERVEARVRGVAERRDTAAGERVGCAVKAVGEKQVETGAGRVGAPPVPAAKRPRTGSPLPEAETTPQKVVLIHRKMTPMNVLW